MYPESAEIQEQFERYLLKPQWGWNWYVTQTFDLSKCGFTRRDGRRSLPSNIVEDSWNTFSRLVGERALCSWGWMFQEKHKNGRPHWHSIFHIEEGLFGEPRASDIWEMLFVKYGRMEIRPFKPELCTSLASYLTKYVAKDFRIGDPVFDFAGYLGGSKADTSELQSVIGLKPFDA